MAYIVRRAFLYEGTQYEVGDQIEDFDDFEKKDVLLRSRYVKDVPEPSEPVRLGAPDADGVVRPTDQLADPPKEPQEDAGEPAEAEVALVPTGASEEPQTAPEPVVEPVEQPKAKTQAVKKVAKKAPAKKG